MTLPQTFRVLVRARGYFFAAVLTMAVGLAATTAVIAVTHAVLLRPLPYPKPERLYRLNAVTLDADRTPVPFNLSPIDAIRND